MWRLKSTPLLWLDLMAQRRESDMKKFFSFLVTQSHPWGYNRDGGVIPWGQRREARRAFGLGDNYTNSDLSQCFPWEANLPVPMALLMVAAGNPKTPSPEDFRSKICELTASLPACWQDKHAEKLSTCPTDVFETILKSLWRLPDYSVHLNLLSHEASENDENTDDDNSLLFVRLNTGGVVLGGEELIFSLFKSAFPEAKDAVEECAAGFLAPSKLFSLLVRLVAAKDNPGKLAKPVNLGDFKKEVRSGSPLKVALEEFIRNEVAELMKSARAILCGDANPTTNFCLPEAVATRTINASPEIFLAMLYWLRQGGQVTLGTEEHRLLIGRYTAVSWFLPGHARAKQETLKEWIAAAGDNVVGRLWTGECLRFLFTREDLSLPVFPSPEHLGTLLRHGVLEVQPYDYERIAASAPDSPLWKTYAFLPPPSVERGISAHERMHGNLMSFLGHLHQCRQILLYSQRSYIQEKFKEFGQWELTLKDTNCPWDWDHIYPSTYNRKSPNRVYKCWHNTIGNLRALGLSENRADGDEWPADKLKGDTEEEGIAIRANSFVPEYLWNRKIKDLGNRHNALQDDPTAMKMCEIVLDRLMAIYTGWYQELRIVNLMQEVNPE